MTGSRRLFVVASLRYDKDSRRSRPWPTIDGRTLRGRPCDNAGKNFRLTLDRGGLSGKALSAFSIIACRQSRSRSNQSYSLRQRRVLGCFGRFFWGYLHALSLPYARMKCQFNSIACFRFFVVTFCSLMRSLHLRDTIVYDFLLTVCHDLLHSLPRPMKDEFQINA